MPSPPEIELHFAATFDCPDCGRENFCRCVTRDLSEVEIESSAELKLNASTRIVTFPEFVACGGCHAKFKGIDPHGGAT